MKLTSIERRAASSLFMAALPGLPSAATRLDVLDTLLSTMPVVQALGARALLLGCALGAPLLGCGWPVPFAWLDDDGRERCLERVLHHRSYLVRQLGTVLKALVCLTTLQSPDSRARGRLVPVADSGPAASPLVIPPRLHSDSTREVLEADYVIIGSGAAGATAARVLTETGRSVVVLEEGLLVQPHELGQGAVASFAHLMRDFGAQVTAGPVFIPILQGACVGGSTVINSGIMWRLPEAVHSEWVDHHGLGAALPWRDLVESFEILERELSIRAVDDVNLGANGRVLLDGARRLGWSAEPTRRSESACEGSGRCLEGCRRGHRQSMNHSYVPQAVKAGARLIPGCRVDRIKVDGRRRWVEADLATPAGHPPRTLTVHATRAIVVAASAVHSPALLQRSGLDFNPHVGRHFQGHPGVAMSALMPSAVRLWNGATQSAEVTQFRKLGIKIESLGIPAEILLVRVPGIGKGLGIRLDELDRVALAATPVKARAQGSVQWGPAGVRIRYLPLAEDMEGIREALVRSAEIYLASGAQAVWPGVHGLPDALKSDRDLDLLRRVSLRPDHVSWVMTHMMGSVRMGRDPLHGAVGPDGALFGVDGVHVIDSSVFPTNLGVNPQLSIMAVAMHLSRRLAGL